MFHIPKKKCCESPKGRNRKERFSSGLNHPARPRADRTVSTRSGCQSTDSKSSIPGQNPRIFLLSQPLRVHQSRPSFVWITHPRRPMGPAPPLSVRAHVAPKRLAFGIVICFGSEGDWPAIGVRLAHWQLGVRITSQMRTQSQCLAA